MLLGQPDSVQDLTGSVLDLTGAIPDLIGAIPDLPGSIPHLKLVKNTRSRILVDLAGFRISV